jgi:hypothetical protein
MCEFLGIIIPMVVEGIIFYSAPGFFFFFERIGPNTKWQMIEGTMCN